MNNGGTPGQGGQNPQDPYARRPGPDERNPYGPPDAGGGQPSEDAPGPGVPQPGVPQPGIPRYGQYAPPGYQAPAPVPTGQPAPWAPPSIGESHRFAWQAFGRSAGVWIAMGLLFLVAGGAVFLVMNPWFGQAFGDLPDVMSSSDPDAVDRWTARFTAASTEPVALALTALAGVILQVMGMTFYAAALASTRRRRIGFADFFALRNWGGILLLAVLTSLIDGVLGMIPVLGGFLQIAVGVLLVAAPYFVLAGNMSALDAITASFRLVTAHLGLVVLAYLIVVAYMFASACTCGLAFFVIGPFSVIFGAHLFRRLQGEPVEAAQPPMAA
ncbi:hypothetical protein [Myceligenerans indicum]|uniref:Integral membrane protein n=1 Tax=Myceligenerans indicum TaxID=2593663 RepID=A0ABS1LNN5_9MICO|nr:hypothetical protein [Myceligenerans indicum]MBL0887887.1 hypothetical protein [Myceligenerans indicum]